MPQDRISTAHTFFDWIKGSADPLATARSLIRSTPPTFETDHLDFKGSIDQGRGTPLPDEKIKEIWSEALGGFANAGGGVLLWGIDARKDEATKVDAADKEILVPNVHAFQSQLKEWQRSANDPPVSGVEFFPVAEASGKSGFLACLIPQSPYPPHNCEYIKNKPYRMRSGDNFINVAPPLLRRLFYSQYSARLEIDIGIYRGTHADPTFHVIGRVTNEGVGTASEPLVILTFPPAMTLKNCTQSDFWILSEKSSTHVFFNERSIHPGSTGKLFEANFVLDQWADFLDFTFEIYSLNNPRSVKSIRFLSDELRARSAEKRAEEVPQV